MLGVVPCQKFRRSKVLTGVGSSNMAPLTAAAQKSGAPKHPELPPCPKTLAWSPDHPTCVPALFPAVRRAPWPPPRYKSPEPGALASPIHPAATRWAQLHHVKPEMRAEEEEGVAAAPESSAAMEPLPEPETMPHSSSSVQQLGTAPHRLVTASPRHCTTILASPPPTVLATERHCRGVAPFL